MGILVSAKFKISPIPTAQIKSTETVIKAVVIRTNALLLVVTKASRTETGFTILAAVTIKMPASALIGICPTTGAISNTHINKSIECTIAENLVLAPERTFTAVRAIAPVAGIPPIIDATTVAKP
jgi:hypothetical protein